MSIFELNERGQAMKDVFTKERPSIASKLGLTGDETQNNVPSVVPQQQTDVTETQTGNNTAQQTDVTSPEKPKTAPSSTDRLKELGLLTPSQGGSLPTPQQPVIEEPKLPQTATHTVRSGDTISDIARRFGVGVNDVTGFKSGNPNLIFPGEQLTINKLKPKAPAVAVKKPIEQRMIEQQEETPEESNAIVTETFANTEVTPDEMSFIVNPYKAFEDTYSQLYDTFQIGRLEDNIKTMLDDFAEVDRKMKEELEKVSDNPWTSQTTKIRESQKVSDKFKEQKDNLTNRIQLFEDTRDKARDEIRFMSETALNQYNTDREFRQDRLDDISDRAERAAKTSSGSGGFTLSPGQMRFDEAGNIIASGGAKPLSATAEAKLLEAKEKDDQALDTQISTLGIVNSILADENLGLVAGKSRLGIRARTASTGLIRAKLTQLEAITSLGEREKLKGSGTISDFEAQMLGNSADALNGAIQDDGRVGLTDEDFTTALNNLKGTLLLKAGQPVMAEITNLSTGETVSAELTREQAQDLYIDGNKIDFL